MITQLHKIKNYITIQNTELHKNKELHNTTELHNNTELHNVYNTSHAHGPHATHPPHSPTHSTPTRSQKYIHEYNPYQLQNTMFMSSSRARDDGW